MTTARPKAQDRVRQMLLDALGTRWQVGSRLPPITDLARELGAGHRNTFMALRELADQGYVRTRQRAGTLVLKTAQPAANSTARGVKVGVVCGSSPDGPIIAPMLKGLMQVMAENGCQTSLIEARRAGQDLTEETYARFDAIAMIQQGLCPIRLRHAQPVVLVSTTACLPQIQGGQCDVIAPDEEQGGALAGRQLRGSGADSVAFVGVADHHDPTRYDEISRIRLRGFESGWGEPVPAKHRFFARAYGEGSGARCVTDYQCLTRRPKAVFAASDELAIGFAMGALGLGYEPGRDYQLIGFDAQPQGQQIPDCPPLTSIAVPLVDMGRRGAQALIGRITDPSRRPERLLLNCDLHLGRTVDLAGLSGVPA